LFKLYLHPDERVHHAAAEATRTLAPVLSVVARGWGRDMETTGKWAGRI
jgi:hypothetical protein